MQTSKSKAPAVIATELRAKGWTMRPAAALLGVHWSHLHRVLSGERHSRSLLSRVEQLPKRKQAAA